MKRMMDLKEHELAQLSAYLDGELNQKEAARLEMLLKADPQLRKALWEMDGTRKLIRSLPQVRPPRNFTLTPEMAGLQQKRSLYPVFRFATVVAAVALTFLVGADAFFRSGPGMMRAPDLASQSAEVAVEMEVEKAAEVVDETMAHATEEVMMLGQAEEPILSEAPRAADAVGTEAFDTGEVEPSTEGNGIQSVLPSETTIPPSEPLHDGTQPTFEEQVSTETQSATPSHEPTPAPINKPEPAYPPISVDPIRTTEAGLGMLALILGVITIILRRQR
ncbi:MAG: hypothetical protein A2Z14_00455 [Chloroflexi bacterium RBG_16_48_8]|nr:MAG: hypothetical protein A2Z14_00455 [Chloroflexi bacterium RBG_16_48_8]